MSKAIINIRLEDIAVRGSEIVKWQGETCFVLAFIITTKDGIDINSVGLRPFDLSDREYYIYEKLIRSIDMLHDSEEISDNE